MDELATYNRERWNALAKARIQYSRPLLELTRVAAQQILERSFEYARISTPVVAGKDVFCLASGGGQQTAVYGLLGANVTVLDLSDSQLERDRIAAEKHGYGVTAVHGDMRDLSQFADKRFDLIHHPYSINFVPEANSVIQQVGRIIHPGGLYRLDFSNPFWTMEETDWTDAGYPIKQPYITGTPLQFSDTVWDVEDEQGHSQKIEGPYEFLHTLSTIFNSLVQASFVILGIKENPPGDHNAAPGTWEHLLSIVPPFLSIVAQSLPEAYKE
jgi:ubiquinone/menaquinone biosynthesis C-methylase UbiE